MPIHKQRFLEKQEKFFVSTAPEVLYSGAFGAGKSYVLCWKALHLGITYPGIFIGIFRKTRTSLTFTTLKTFLEIVPRDYIDNYNKSESYIRLINGSEYIFGGLEEPSRWGSLNLGAVFCDELVEFDEADYNMLLGRLRQSVITGADKIKRLLPFRQAGGATNPGSPTHWLYQRAFVDKHMEVIESTTTDNIFNPKSYLDLVKKFKGRYYERYVLGKWVSFEGAVYDIYSPLVHIVKPFKIPTDWRRLRSIDFGYSNPFSCQWWAVSPEGVMYLYRELYGSKKLVSDWAIEIEELSKHESYEVTLADWDAEDRATLERSGITTTQAVKDISPGIQAVYSRMMYDDKTKPRIFFFEDCLKMAPDENLVNAKKPVSILDEIPGYSWPRAKNGKPIKEVPIKIDDHGLDPMRYAALYLESQAPPEGDIIYSREYNISDSEY